MKIAPAHGWKERAEEERLRLETGEKRSSRFPHKLQRTAVRLLAGFFALMLAFTLLSRAADGLTVPRVETGTARSGVLTRRYTASGTIESQGDLALELPAGVPVDGVRVREGQRVQAGDVLLELNREGLDRSIAQLKNDLRVLELKLENAALGNTTAGTDAILAAQRALEQAQEDHSRLQASRARTERRSEEDLTAAQADRDEAQAALNRAEEKAKKNLIQAAEDKVEAAKEHLDAVRETAQSAIEGAQDAVTAAEDAKNAYSKGYYEAVEQQGKLEEQLSAARQTLADLEAAGASEEELQAAREKVEALAAQVDAAGWNVPNYNYSSDLAIRRAKDNLTKVTERQAAKIAQAEAKVQEAEEELKKTRSAPDISEEGGVTAARSALEAAEQGVLSANRALEDAGAATAEQVFAAQRAVESAQAALEQAERQAEEARRTDANSRRQAEIEALGYRSQREELGRKLSALEEAAAAGGVLAAPIDGTVLSVMAEPGLTQEGQQVAVLSRSDRGFLVRGSLDQEEAAKLAAGDAGTLSFTQDGKSRELDVVLESVGAPDDKGMVEVTSALPEGTYPAGASARMEITRRSEQYPLCLPLSALRSDTGSDYVLVLREVETVLGLEQTAVKVPVTVLEKDSELMAVSASLTRDDAVIVSASKPVAEGDRVRLGTK